jgi:peptide/nickel transport system permease protein
VTEVLTETVSDRRPLSHSSLARYAGRFVRRPGAVVAAVYLVALAFVALFPTLITSIDPNAQDISNRFASPGDGSLLGTDGYGRDLFTRLVYGARTSLGVAVVVVVAAFLVALPLGLLAGYRGGWFDRIIMRFTDAGLSLPPLILALAIAGTMGPGARNAMIALTIIYTPMVLRLVRGESLSRRQETFIEASESAGTSTPRLLRRRLLPNISSALFIAAAFWFGSAILAEASLSYLGVGVRPPTASWGGMLRQAYDTSLFTDPLQLVIPGTAIAVTILAFNTLGEGLRDVFGVASVDRRGKAVRGLTTVDIRQPVASARPRVVDRPEVVEDSRPLLQVRDLSVEFSTDHGPVRVVDGLDLRIRRGEVLGLVGESGSGKSVTALSVMRLLPSPPGSIVGGEVVFDGTDLLGLSGREMRRYRGPRMAMVFQDPMTSLDPSFTVGHQLEEAVLLHSDSSRSAARARARELLDLVQIPEAESRLSDHPHQLSGGMRQRVVLALALACGPELLIADEPTTALDVTVQAQILDLLRELRDELSMAMLFVTHDLGVVAEICDRVAVMYAGQIVEESPVRELFAAPNHPYTEGLLRAMPRMEARSARLAVIPGEVPMMSAMPPGCRFHPRCAYSTVECQGPQTPSMVVVSSDRSARCVRVGEIELRGSDPSPVDPSGSVDAR